MDRGINIDFLNIAFFTFTIDRIMKQRFLLAALAFALSVSSNVSSAQTTLIHYWNFNSVLTFYHIPFIPDFVPDFTLIDTNQARIKYVLESGTTFEYAGYVDNVTSADTLNLRMSQPAGQALRVRNPTDSIELQFCIPTTGYKNIRLKYVLESSSATSGMLTELFDYSVDGGATWKNRTGGLTINGSNCDTLDVTQDQYQGANWGLVDVTFGNDAAVNNNPKLIFRIKFAGNTSLAKGNNRFDDFTVDGTPMGVSLVAAPITRPNACTLYPNPTNEQVTIATHDLGDKTVVISDLAGNTLSSSREGSGQVTISTAHFAAGTYRVSITNETTGQRHSTLLVKE